MIKAVTFGVLALSASVSIALADGADFEDFFGHYFHRSDTIGVGAGDAKEVNANAQIIDPWPAGVGNRRHPADGQRMNSGASALSGCPQDQGGRSAPGAGSHHYVGLLVGRQFSLSMRGCPMSALDRQKCGSAFGRRRTPSCIVAGLFAGFLALLLAGCGPTFGDFGALTSLTIQEPESEKFFPSDEPYQIGVENFNRGHYGVAETRFQEAVEKAPGDALAWVALAATYDRMMRFDFADRAYARAIAISGETAQILNNQGYSHMLRGNLKTARQKFTKAAAMDPANPTIQNNILLLDGSGAYFAQKARKTASR